MSTPDQDATARIDSDVRHRARRQPDAQFAPGTIIAGRYRIASILGSGGMGEVYRADDVKLDQAVALKFLPVRLERDPVLLGRLHDEVRLGRQIAHPNVCRIYDIVETPEAHFVSMEYVDGEDLSRLLRRIGRLAHDKAVDIARGIAAGLAAAHAKGILHRDLKPANVMVDSRGEARIMDFGLALAAGEDDGTISGTPAYMAPEQLEGRTATVQSDLYALGLVMYELFTGRRAHHARTMPERIRDTSDIATPSSVIRDIDPAVERVILRCLAADPMQRPASAREVMLALPGGDPLAAALAAGETPSPRIVAAAGTEGSLRPVTAWTLLGALSVALVAIFLHNIGTAYWKRAGLTRSPDVQADRVTQMLRGFGLPAQTFDTYGYSESLAHGAWLMVHDPERLHNLGHGFSILRFWLREEPEPMLDNAFLHNPKVARDDPPPSAPGSTAVEVDPSGRLLYLRAIASPALRPRPLDWNPVLGAAGLDLHSLRPEPATFLPPGYADARAAWRGTYPEDGTPIRVEAAAARGVPVYFRIIAPWDEQDVSAQIPFGSANFTLVGLALIALAALAGSVIAWRNLRARRGDRQGAWRIASALFLAALVEYVAYADHEVALMHELRIAVQACSYALLTAAIYWLVYLAVEPAVRRRWPQGLISWTRLLAGKWRDPMVGRDVLAGVTAGVIHSLIAGSDVNLRSILSGERPFPSVGGDVGMLDSVLLPFARLAGGLVNGAAQALTIALVVMMIMLVVRRPAAVGVAIAALFLGLLSFASTDPVMLAVFAVIAALHAFVLMRFGVLGIAAALATFGALFFSPIPDAVAWYTARALIPTAAIVALAAFAFRTSLGSQPAFGSASGE